MSGVDDDLIESVRAARTRLIEASDDGAEPAPGSILKIVEKELMFQGTKLTVNQVRGLHI